MSWELDGFSDLNQSSGDESSYSDDGSATGEVQEERLVRAVLRGDGAGVVRLLASCPQLAKAREASYPGRSVVACAAVQGEVEMVSALLGAGADVEARDLEGSSALVAMCGREEGCGRGHREAMQTLLQAGADVLACRNDGGCALPVAAAQGHVALVRLLLPWYRGRGGKGKGKGAISEALWDACVEGDVRMVEVLVREGGGDVWAGDGEGDGGAPIEAAREQRHTHVLDWIQRYVREEKERPMLLHKARCVHHKCIHPLRAATPTSTSTITPEATSASEDVASSIEGTGRSTGARGEGGSRAAHGKGKKRARRHKKGAAAGEGGTGGEGRGKGRQGMPVLSIASIGAQGGGGGKEEEEVYAVVGFVVTELADELYEELRRGLRHRGMGTQRQG